MPDGRGASAAHTCACRGRRRARLARAAYVDYSGRLSGAGISATLRVRPRPPRGDPARAARAGLRVLGEV
ncbi:MAG: hypothetical protein IPQ09_30830 [Myxococcales bacterium]|nr:hypothetical protein [Myxococcales bacterium]